MARDGGTPSKSSTAIIDIAVVRNQHSPIFSNPNMRVSITDNTPAGSSVIQVEATDNDQEVCVSPTILYRMTLFEIYDIILFIQCYYRRRTMLLNMQLLEKAMPLNTSS